MDNMAAQSWQAIIVCVSAVFTQNILLSYFLGMCSFLAVSREVKASNGLGAAVTFTIVVTCLLNWVIYYYILVPMKLEYFRFIVFIIVVAAFVQFVEMILEKYSPALYQSLGIFLPLIVANCSILGAALFMLIREYTFIVAIGWSLGSGLGWWMAIIAMAGIRQRLATNRIPAGLQGSGITLLIAGMMALGFIGLSGILTGP